MSCPKLNNVLFVTNYKRNELGRVGGMYFGWPNFCLSRNMIKDINCT